jgi:hypothetical protein
MQVSAANDLDEVEQWVTFGLGDFRGLANGIRLSRTSSRGVQLRRLRLQAPRPRRQPCAVLIPMRRSARHSGF